MDLLSRQELLDDLAHRVILPYAIMAVILALLAAGIYFSHLPDIHTDEEQPETIDNQKKRTSIFHFPHLILGVITLFLYVGVEVIAVDTIISYGAFQSIPLSMSKFFSSFTLGGMLCGYIVGLSAYLGISASAVPF